MKTKYDFDNPTNNFENYKWGMFYFNPSDKRLFVPKRKQFFGQTLNFANPYAYIVLACIIVLASMVAYLF